MAKTLLLILISMALINCKQDSQIDTQSEDLASSLEDAITSVSATMDDQQGESYATYKAKSNLEVIQDIILPRAYASNCTRPVHMACENQSQVSVFQDCSLFRGQVLASGQIQLDYSTVNCTLENEGDQVARTYDYELVGPRGGQLQVSSNDHDDYLGENIGGGALLTKASAGWNLEILGKHKVFTRNGRVRMDKSIRTTQPLEISGGLRRQNRQINNGQIQVSHNLAEFTATYTAEDLQWSSSCCHPVSGSLSVEYTGSIQGTGKVTFNSCGQASLERNGETQNVEFSYCE